MFLTVLPQYHGKCKMENLSARNLAQVIKAQPQLMESVDKRKLDMEHWLEIFRIVPSVAEVCDFSSFGKDDIGLLLKECPDLSKYIL